MYVSLNNDASHALGVSYQGKVVGNMGNAEVLCFHILKIFEPIAISIPDAIAAGN